MIHTPPLQIVRGIYSELPSLTWGEPAAAYIPCNDGTDVESVWTGGRDGTNKLTGGGFQSCYGEPTFPAPRGVTVFDYLNQYLWTSNGWQNDPYGLNQKTAPTAFLGWTAFCSCISGLPPWPSSGGSGSSGSGGGPGPDGGGGGGILNPCCPGGMAATQYLAVSDACDSQLNGTYTLTWDAEADSWNSADFDIGGNTYVWRFGCQTSRGTFVVSLNQVGSGFSASVDWVAAGFVCVPFDCNGEGAPNGGSLTSLCSGNLYMTWSVTD